MGYQLGMPSLKLSNTSKPSKHCGNFGAVTKEALEEREGRDLDINPELSHLNIIQGFRTSADLIAYSDAHVKELKDASGRAIRKDAVRMCGTICKPPAVYINKIIREQGEAAAEKFFDDFLKRFEKIVGKENVKSTVLHKDELGWHMHIFWEPMTEDGRLCAKEVHGLKFFAQMNREMPEYLRSCGWEIEDCNCYDCAEENYENEKARAEKEEENYRRTHGNGRSSAQYKAEAEAEKQQLVADVEVLKKEAEFEHTLAEHEKVRVKEASEKLQFLENEIEKAEASMQTVFKTKKEYDQELNRFDSLFENPDSLFQRQIQNHLQTIRKGTRQEIEDSFQRFLRPFKYLAKLFRNAFGFENKTNMPKPERRSPDVQRTLDETLWNATERSESNAAQVTQKEKEQEL